MSVGLWYWLILVLCLVFGLYRGWPALGGQGNARYIPLGMTIIQFILFVLIGLTLYGSPIKW